MASKKVCVDNFHFGGMAASVDIATGIVTSPGRGFGGQICVTSPISGETIPGRIIPSWDKVCAISKEIADILRKMNKRYIALDISVLENGTPELVEVNWFGDSELRQLTGFRPHGKYWETMKMLEQSK